MNRALLDAVGIGLKLIQAILVAWFLTINNAAAYEPLNEKLPDCPVMPGAKWQWVGRSMVVNGIPMSIKLFSLHGSSGDLVEFYNSYWRTRGHGAVTDKLFGSTRILGYELDGYFTSVQFVDEMGSISGKIVVSLSPAVIRPSKKSTLPVPPGSTVVSRIESKDEAAFSESLTVLVDRSTSFTEQYYQNQLIHAGWQLVREDRKSMDWAAQFQSEVGTLQINIKPLPGQDRNRSKILVHWLKQ